MPPPCPLGYGLDIFPQSRPVATGRWGEKTPNFLLCQHFFTPMTSVTDDGSMQVLYINFAWTFPSLCPWTSGCGPLKGHHIVAICYLENVSLVCYISFAVRGGGAVKTTHLPRPIQPLSTSCSDLRLH